MHMKTFTHALTDYSVGITVYTYLAFVLLPQLSAY